MRRHVRGIGVVWLLLAACQSQPRVEAPSRAQLADEILRSTPPDDEPGICWATETAPAVIETVTEQEVVSAEQRDETGRITAPATFRSTTKQRMVQDRQEVWFREPCPEVLTADVVATLQRALKARGLYRQPLTGQMDTATADAIRRFQAERGLDSPQLSLAAAKELGVISTELDAL